MALPSVLKENGYNNLVGSKTCAFQRGLNTTDNIMEHLASHPEQAAWSAAYMAAHKSDTNTWMDGSVPLKDFTLSAADVEKGRAMMVDVGGGSGHQLLSLRAAQPQLKGSMVVQDVDIMIATVDKAAAERAGVEAMVHDFYTPQPVKGAKVYYLRSVLHDWTDDLCTKILLQLREAMAEDSVIVLDEIVIPDKGARIMQMHSDLAMLAALGARERSESQWSELLSTAGLHIRNVWTYDEGLGGSLIMAIPA
jgi:demethylsterigmatocystin 6-O-methyltransferase